MKKVIILLIAIVVLFANNKYELKLYEKIFPTLFRKSRIFVYTANVKDKELFRDSYYIVVVRNCIDADFILIDKNENISAICLDKPRFVTDYHQFLNMKNVIGAFYWRKGRPQLYFKKDNVKKYNLNITKELGKFLK